ncbi:MAG: T9SS type A sorting domain-containing protein, partial [Ignavibacteriaceae bacterium]
VSASVFNNGNEIPYIFRTYDGGNNWTSFETPSQENFYLISFFTGTKVCAISTNGKVYLTEDAGETWSFTNSTLTGKKYLKMVENNSGWCVGNGIWKTTDGGENWVQKREGSYTDAHFFNELSGWVISSSTLLHTYDGGETWNIIELPESDLLFLDFIDSMNGWIYTSNEKLLRTTNGGVTFIDEEKSNFFRPVEFYLHQNYPNPFNPGTKISWQVPVGSWQTLKVYDVLGREVVTLVNEYKEAGNHEVEFLPESSIKNPASGVYFYQLQSGDFIETKKMILLR